MADPAKLAVFLISSSFIWSAAFADGSSSSTRAVITGASGQTITIDKSNSDKTDWDGTHTHVTDKSVVVDPKGHGKERSTSLHDEKSVEPNGDYSETKVITDAAGTKSKVVKSKSTSKHWINDGETVTTIHAKSVDPKGLGNKHTEVEEKVVDSSEDGTGSVTVVKKVDGKTVAESTTETK